MIEPTGVAVVPGPREVFAHMQQQWLGTAPDLMDSELADDVVIETPFAPPGRPRRFQGRKEFLEFAKAERASLPVCFEECRDVVIHETADPEVIVVEYELAGTVTTTDHRAAAPFIGVLRVRDGKIVHWREYQDALAIAQALGQLPALLASVTAGQPDSALSRADAGSVP
jgi:ketosteroid isomerase-like protein